MYAMSNVFKGLHGYRAQRLVLSVDAARNILCPLGRTRGFPYTPLAGGEFSIVSPLFTGSTNRWKVPFKRFVRVLPPP